MNSFAPTFANANYKNTEGYKINNTDYPWDKTKHDAAYNEWGGSWRMPTGSTTGEFKALKDATKWTWDSTDKGYYITKSGETLESDKSNALLFFPAAGISNGASRSGAGSCGYYWSSTWYSSSYADYLCFDSSGVYLGNYSSRYVGLSVRPVSD